MTKSEFIARLAQLNPRMSHDDIKAATEKIFECIETALTQGDRIEIRGFGSFSIRHRKARIARNPKTGEKFQLPGRSVPHFKPGKKLRKLVNNSPQTSNPPQPSLTSSAASVQTNPGEKGRPD